MDQLREPQTMKRNCLSRKPSRQARRLFTTTTTEGAHAPQASRLAFFAKLQWASPCHPQAHAVPRVLLVQEERLAQ